METKKLKFLSRINTRILIDVRFKKFKHMFLHLAEKHPTQTAINCAMRLRLGIDF